LDSAAAQLAPSIIQDARARARSTTQLEELRVAADHEDTEAVAEAAPGFVEAVAGLQLTG
jgi:hypothetical protein